jgi:hypothetical protein
MSEDLKQLSSVQADLIRLLAPCGLKASQLPSLCVLGMQSHGKSSLVQAFVGFPITLVQMGTGTRCPTRFYLEFKEDAEEK